MSKTGIIQVSLRLTPDVYEMLKTKADDNGRSLNSEAIQAIIEHCEPDSLTNSLANQLYELGQRLNALESIVTPARPQPQESEPL